MNKARRTIHNVEVIVRATHLATGEIMEGELGYVLSAISERPERTWEILFQPEGKCGYCRTLSGRCFDHHYQP